MNKPTIVYFGTPDYSATILQSLVDAGYPVAAVITAPDRAKGRNGKPSPSPVKACAEKNNISVFTPTSLQTEDRFFETIKKLSPDLFVVCSYGKILPQDYLDIPKIMTLNIHYSLLPKYRGAAPIQAQILAGEKETGITISKMVFELDAGPILAQQSLPLADNDTTQSVVHRSTETAMTMLLSLLEKDLTQVSMVPQNDKAVSFAPRITKDDGFFDLSTTHNLQPENFSRLVRAYYPWPGVWTILDSKRIKFLPNQMAQLEGKAPVPIKQLLNGYPQLKPLVTGVDQP